MIEDTKEFAAELAKVKAEIESFKDIQTAKFIEDNLKKLSHLQTNLKELTEKMNIINSKEQDLEFSISEFPMLDHCKKSIQPF